MSVVRLILALHDHQPVGNFDGVFEAAYRDSYLPFLEVLEDYPQIPFVLHTSGPLMEWLVEHRPEYVARVRALVEAGRVEILGGGFYEPILTMIPHRDRVGQIRSYSEYLHDQFGTPVRGMWIPERVWEQHLVSAMAEAGIEYTVLDDFHFHRAGLLDDELTGYYLTEDDGRLLKVFPASERIRYLIPFKEPHATYEYLRQVSERHPGAAIVFADDGEKFGAWPDTQQHIYANGWLRRFCDMIVGNRDWLIPTTFQRVVDSTLPVGKIYLPDSSYREMTEWVLPPARLTAYLDAVRQAGSDPGFERIKPFVRGGGIWRNFKAKYAESDEMYARMLEVSQRLSRAESSGEADPDYLDIARQELYRGQCNCPFWHGAFGGLYLPHLRNAIYRHLIAAHNALDEAEGRSAPRATLDVADFNLDARQEVRLENDKLIAYVRPAKGGHIYELDVRHALTNVSATLDRRPEAYHSLISGAAHQSASEKYDGPASIQNRVVMKQEGLDRRLVYDVHPRKSLVDHFYPFETTLDDLQAGRDLERGDFVLGAYLSKVHRSGDHVSLLMERPGRVDGHSVRIRKTVELIAGRPELEVHYTLDELPHDVTLHLAVEFNLAAMAGHADDRYYCDSAGRRLGLLDARLDLQDVESIRLTDEWLDLDVGLEWSTPGGLWCFPIETVSQSESGFEGVYQSSAVVPHWRVVGDEAGQWQVRIRWRLDRFRVSSADAAADVRLGSTPAMTGAEP